MELKAKDTSLYAKIGAVFVIIIGTALKGLGILKDISVTDMIWVGAAIAGIFGTVDLNLMLEKITGRK